MSMSLGLSLSHSQTLSQDIELSQKQILGQTLGLTQKLVQRLRGIDEVYRPKGDCPRCERKLTPAEIVLGFNRDPNDFTTKCPRCNHRFAPILISRSIASSIQVPFFCRAQLLAQLQTEMTDLSVDEFKKSQPAIYRSATYHFGSLKTAFAEIGMKYNREPKVDKWQKKVLLFLGKLPDSLIASNANVSVGAVRKLRREKNIDAYRRR